MENVIASVILIIAVAGIVGLVAYRSYKTNKNLTVDQFVSMYYDKLVGALQDVVSLLLINIENYPDKESYEKDIIHTTIEKLEENCVAFGIDASLFNLVNKDALTEILYNIFYNEEVSIFTATVPKDVIEANPELYDEAVVDLYDYDQEIATAQLSLDESIQ